LKNVSHIHSTVALGLVISTDPKSGKTLKTGQKVDLVVSLGVQALPIKIPSVKGLSLAQATNELENKPYDLNVKTGFLQSVPPGVSTTPDIVISEVPKATSAAHQGDTITIYVLSPNADFGVPKLAGDTTNQAAGVLGQYNLTVGTTTTACSNTYGIGEVNGSNPAEGTLGPYCGSAAPGRPARTARRPRARPQGRPAAGTGAGARWPRWSARARS